MIHSPISDHINGEPITRHLPIDDLEPLPLRSDEIRDARVQTVRLLNAFANVISRSLSERHVSVQSIAANFWGAAYGLGLNCCDGMSMRERAQGIGTDVALISKVAVSLCAANDLAPSYYMKDTASAEAYREARLRVIIHSNGNGSNGSGEVQHAAQ